MCTCIISWEPDADVDGAHRLRPVTCQEVRNDLVARVQLLEGELVAQMAQVASRADKTERSVLVPPYLTALGE